VPDVAGSPAGRLEDAIAILLSHRPAEPAGYLFASIERVRRATPLTRRGLSNGEGGQGEDTERFIDRHVRPGEKRPSAPSVRRDTGAEPSASKIPCVICGPAELAGAAATRYADRRAVWVIPASQAGSVTAHRRRVAGVSVKSLELSELKIDGPLRFMAPWSTAAAIASSTSLPNYVFPISRLPTKSQSADEHCSPFVCSRPSASKDRCMRQKKPQHGRGFWSANARGVGDDGSRSLSC
jgi:hypothetical protein